MHPKSKCERVERTANVRFGAGAGSHRAGVYFQNFTGTPSNSCRITAGGLR
jgi:hypothetical protein